jgi:hypothetical protein
MLHRAVALISVAICCVLVPVALHRRHRVAGFLVLVLLALPINALITGGLSGPHDRYQSRVMWLPPLLAALAIAGLAIRAPVTRVLPTRVLPTRALPTGAPVPRRRARRFAA